MKIKLTERTVAALPAPTDAAQAYYWDTNLKRNSGVILIGSPARSEHERRSHVRAAAACEGRCL